MAFGSQAVTAHKIGTQDVSRIYRGSAIVFEADTWNPEQLSINEPSRRMGWWARGQTEMYQNAAETTLADTDGQNVVHWKAGPGSEAGLTLEKDTAGDGPVLATRDGLPVLRFDGTTHRPLGVPFSPVFERLVTWYFICFNDSGVTHRLADAYDEDDYHLILLTDSDQYAAYLGGQPDQNRPSVQLGLHFSLLEANGLVSGSSPVSFYGPTRAEYTGSTGDKSSGGFYLGGKPTNEDPLDVAAVVCVEGKLTPEERVKLWEWGLSLVPDTVSNYSDFVPRTIDPALSWQPDINRTRTVVETEAGKAPAFFPCIVDVSDDTDFDNVNHATTGERLNYLLYTSTDHRNVSYADGGVYLTCLFGDPVEGGAVESYADALSGGHLANFTGGKPTPGTNSQIFPDLPDGSQTGWVRKVGFEWVMTHFAKGDYVGPFDGALSVGTIRSASSSPFGPFAKTPTAETYDVFLNNYNDPNNPSAEHTGYAYWDETPANATFPHAFFISSLYSGSVGGSSVAIWGADQDMLNPVLVGVYPTSGSPQVTIPSWQRDSGNTGSVSYPRASREMRWDGAKFRTLARGGYGGGGGSGSSNLLIYEGAVDADLVTPIEPFVPVIGPDDITYFFAGADRMTYAQTIKRPNGEEAMVVEVQNDDATADEGVLIIPVTYTGPIV